MTPDRFLQWTVRGHLALLPVLLLLVWLDPRELQGANLWWKPVKFFVSITIYLATIRYLLQWSPNRVRNWVGGGTAITMIGESVIITLQAARGVRSHFNDESASDAILFGVMGVLIAINTILLAWLAAWHFSQRIPAGEGVLWGIRWGLLMTLLASAVGGVMIANQGHTIGLPDGGAGLPFLNWSTRAGDLRAAHFIGLHGIQVLPLIGWAIDQSDSPRAWLLALVAALAYFAITVILLLQALGGKPLMA